MSLFFQPEELTLVVENVLQDSNLAAHDSAHSKLNNSKNLEPQQPKFKNNCLKMVNNNLTATTKCNQRIECHQPNLPIQDDDEENDDLEHGNDSQELMASPWYQQGLSRYATRCFTCCPMLSILKLHFWANLIISFIFQGYHNWNSVIKACWIICRSSIPIPDRCLGIIRSHTLWHCCSLPHPEDTCWK